MSRPQLKLPFIFTIIAVLVTMSLLAPGPTDTETYSCTGCVHAHKTVSDDDEESSGEEGVGEYLGGAEIIDEIDGLDDDEPHLDDGEF